MFSKKRTFITPWYVSYLWTFHFSPDRPYFSGYSRVTANQNFFKGAFQINVCERKLQENKTENDNSHHKGNTKYFEDSGDLRIQLIPTMLRFGTQDYIFKTRPNWLCIMYSRMRTLLKLSVMFCAIWYHLHNLKYF